LTRKFGRITATDGHHDDLLSVDAPERASRSDRGRWRRKINNRLITRAASASAAVRNPKPFLRRSLFLVIVCHRLRANVYRHRRTYYIILCSATIRLCGILYYNINTFYTDFYVLSYITPVDHNFIHKNLKKFKNRLLLNRRRIGGVHNNI